MTTHVRRAKIVATLGPSSSDVETIERLIRAGMNVARINMSHGTHEGHAQVIANVRKASQKIGWEVAILLDLQGPKIRVDKLDKPLELLEGDEWVIGATKHMKDYPEYKDKFIPTVYEDLVKDSQEEGVRILFDDGLIVAHSLGVDRDVLRIKIDVGGTLKSNKGINLPDVAVSCPAFTKKDEEDLIFGLQQGIDYVALSFVRTGDDILQVKYLLHKLKMNVPIVAKIEKPQAIDNLKEILNVTDVIMVARGDMGVELGNHLVPTAQKKIIQACNEEGIPVITATQMLESMITNSSPTRAEATDVANAIWDGTDAVMLSGETAAGKYPIRAVAMMNQIIVEAERTPKERPLLRRMDLSSVNDAIMVSASLIAEKVKAKRIISVSQSGNSCRRIARFRPHVRVTGLTNDIRTVRKICLYWGVTPFLLEEFDEHNEELELDVIKELQGPLDLKNGDRIVITRGDGKFFHRGSANSVRVETIRERREVLGGDEGLEVAEFSRGQINFDTRICGSCQNCVAVCPYDIWKVTQDDERRTYIDYANVDNCALDMECVALCPTGAVEIIPKGD